MDEKHDENGKDYSDGVDSKKEKEGKNNDKTGEPVKGINSMSSEAAKPIHSFFGKTFKNSLFKLISIINNFI